MFGTLINDVQRKESLTFVENTDPASALSQSRRDKPHTSCKFCRSRKIRCSGQPSGCDRCVAVGAQCQYPGREPRRRKNTINRRTDETWSQIQEKRSPFGDGKVQRARTPPQTTDANIGVYSLDSRPDLRQEQVEQWLSSHSVGDGSSSGSGIEEWLDIDNFLDSMQAMPLDNHNDEMQMLDDTLRGPISQGVDGLNDFDSISTSSFPSPESLVQQLMASPYDSSSPLPFSNTHTHAQHSASDSRNSKGNTQRGRPSDASSSGHSRAPTTTTLNKVRTTPESPPDRNFRPTSSPLTKSSPAAEAVRAVIPDVSGQDYAKNGCNCLQLVARLLEELGSESVSSDPEAMDGLLSCFRRALVHCATILDCKECTSLSEINMLLAMAGRYMSITCERIVMCYNALRQAHEQQPDSRQRSISPSGVMMAGDKNGDGDVDMTESNNSNGVASPGGHDMWFSRYRIESSSERIQVLRCLVKVQLSEFSWLLEKLKARAGNRKGHLALLTEAEKNVKDVLPMLWSSSDRLLADKSTGLLNSPGIHVC